MTFDAIKDQVSALNDQYLAGYNDAKAELRLRLGAVNSGSLDAVASLDHILKVVREFIK